MVRSVARCSVESDNSEAMTSSGVPICTSIAVMRSPTRLPDERLPVAARRLAARPRRLQHREVTVHQDVAVVAVEPEGGEGSKIAARSDAHLETVAAHQVGDHGILGDADRHLERQSDDASAEPDATG